MNLISCGQCGVVFDKDNMTFEGDYIEEGGYTNEAVWDDECFRQSCQCPICHNLILGDRI